MSRFSAFKKAPTRLRLPVADPPYPSDEAAIPDCRRGCAVAQRFLYSRYADSMMVVCSRYLPRREDAEEALMDSFSAFFRGLPRFVAEGPGSVRAWLKKIVVNQCLMALRKQRGRPAFTPIDESFGDEATADADVLPRINAREILTAVHDLPDGYRTVFNLFVFEGWSHAEIAASLGISGSTSKTQLMKARRAVAESLRRAHSFHAINRPQP